MLLINIITQTTMTVKQAVITDAGVSTRFFPVVKTMPKSFIPIDGKPIIHILVEELKEAGIEKVIIVTREEYGQRYVEVFANLILAHEFVWKRINELVVVPEIVELIIHGDEPWKQPTPSTAPLIFTFNRGVSEAIN